MQWRVTVQAGKGFSPQRQQAQSGDAVFWFNEDEHETHQPESTDPNAKWSIAPIVGRNSSELLNLNSVATVSYKCKNHPEETGTLVVAQGIPIAYEADPLFSQTIINRKQCVTWANSDEKPHQPCPDSGDPWFTEPIASGDISSTITFDNPGTFGYHCAVHPNETGSIAVGRQITIQAGAEPLFGTTQIGVTDGVLWTNTDNQSHQPAPDSADTWLQSPVAAGATSAVVTFASAGSFPYHCAVHPDNPNETGTIVVS